MKIKTIFKLFPGLIFIFCLLAISFNLPIFAQSTSNCGGGTPARAEGLVTTPSRTGQFGTSGACIDNDSKVVFAFFKIPTYADLISTYYDQSKLTKNTVSTFPTSFGADGIYKTSGDLTVGGSPTGSGTEVIFVEGNLNITSNLIYHTNDTLGGLVFMVKGDVIISSTITQVDAVIIVQGKIYTAGSGCTANSVTTPGALTVNGSFISLNQIDSSPIKFCRKLTDNNLPAEIINHQVKYLVLLRSLMSNTLQKWSEIDASIPLPTPGPTSAPSPTPTAAPTPTPSPTPSACIPTTAYPDADGDGWDDGGTTTSVGPNNGSTFTSVQSTQQHYIVWNSPSGAQTEGTSDAYANLFNDVNNVISQWLIVKGFGFNIPSSALITGIVVEIKRGSRGTGSSLQDRDFHIIKGNALVGNDHADGINYWPNTAPVYKTYGTSTDDWGIGGWKAADINSAGFGVAISALQAGAGSITAYIDHVRITVYYKPTATPVSQCPTAGYSTGTSGGVDCDNASATNWRIRYPDVDADTYSSMSGTCVGNQAGYADTSTDCLDSDANVKPGQTSYFNNTLNNNFNPLGYDYNCDGTLEANATDYCTGSSVGDNFYDLSNCTSSIAGQTRYLVYPTAVSGNIGKACGAAECNLKYYCSGEYACECSEAAHGTGANVGCR